MQKVEEIEKADGIVSTAKVPISVIVATRNEARNLPQCLESLREVGEVYVVDSGSSDATPDIARSFGEFFPWGTVLVNVSGSLVIGFFDTLTGPDGRLLAGTTARQFVMIGICGGYTTFSSFSLQTMTLAQDGEFVRAGMNVGFSVVLCLISVWLGHVAAAAINAVRGS